MQTDDRLSIFTPSGQVQQEFTADRDNLNQELQRIVSRPISGHSSINCRPMTFYEA